jgi:hypothetical protein
VAQGLAPVINFKNVPKVFFGYAEKCSGSNGAGFFLLSACATLEVV